MQSEFCSTQRTWRVTGQHVKPESVEAAVDVTKKLLVENGSLSDVVKKRERSDSEVESGASKKSKSDQDVAGGKKQADGSILFDLSSKKLVSVRAWKSAILVDIREYFDSNGERKPGKKGISLTTDQFHAVMNLIDDIDLSVNWVQNPDKSVANYTVDTLSDVEPNSISSKRRVSVRKFKSMVLVDIREYYDANGTMKPGNKGISLTKEQWNVLKSHVDAIKTAMALLV
ncbi:hypothetical protein DYB32_006597, partial [Aphanomyces invadans]